MARKKRRQEPQNAQTIRRQLISLEADRESLAAQAQPNKSLLESIDRKRRSLTDLLEKLEKKDKDKAQRKKNHSFAKKDTIERKEEQREAIAVKTSFVGGTLKLNK